MKTIGTFATFLNDHNIQGLEHSAKVLMAMYKTRRLKEIRSLKQARGGGSIALEVAILRGALAFGIEAGLMNTNPIKQIAITADRQAPPPGRR